jgi:hypothetical protein
MIKNEEKKVVSLRHHSLPSPVLCVLDYQSDVVMSVHIPKEIKIYNFVVDDPVIIIFELSEKFYTANCSVGSIDSKSHGLNLIVNELDSTNNKRRHERYPVSLYADIRGENDKKRSLASVKNISLTGFMIYSPSKYLLSTLLDIDVYMDRDVFTVKGRIVRRVERKDIFEYGIKLEYYKTGVKILIQDYILKLEEENVQIIEDIYRHKRK